jgi:dihydroorotase
MNRPTLNNPIKTDKMLLEGARILDPTHKIDQEADILIENGTIKEIGELKITGNIKRFDLSGKVIVPGFIDMHVHLREPGNEDKESIETGCRAAMAGGFTAVCCMPNTNPPIDSRGQVQFVKERAETMMIDVHPIPAITKGQHGEELTEMGDMLQAGAVAFSDDGRPVKNAVLFRRALEYAGMLGAPIIEHCEDRDLSGIGVMNEGVISTKLGLKGIPAISEDTMTARNILIAEYTGNPLHLAHVSTKISVGLIREAKQRGIQVSAETCPHYLVLTDEAIEGYDTNAKMNPPLRGRDDQAALIEGLKDGTIDAICTDHAPHLIDDKDCDFNIAAFGIIGLETAIGLILTHFYHKNEFSLETIIEKMSVFPRKILNLPDIHLSKGHSANMTILDLKEEWQVDKDLFLSKARNTPFHGWELKGRAIGVCNKDQLFLSI